jgi:hypothetical protein
MITLILTDQGQESFDMTANTKTLAKEKEKTKDLIDLNKQFSPHPLVLKAYKEKDAMELYRTLQVGSPEIDNENRVFSASKASGSPIRHKITGLYRRKVGNKEYVIFHEHLATLDYFKNPVDHSRFVGKVEVPIITRHYAINPLTIRSDQQQIRPTEQAGEVQGHNTVYEYEFEAVKSQLEKWYRTGVIDENTKLYAWDDLKYSVRKFDDFIRLPFDDLILLARVGNKLTGIFKPEDMTKEILDMFRQTIKQEVQQQQKGLTS